MHGLTIGERAAAWEALESVRRCSRRVSAPETRPYTSHGPRATGLAMCSEGLQIAITVHQSPGRAASRPNTLLRDQRTPSPLVTRRGPGRQRKGASGAGEPTVRRVRTLRGSALRGLAADGIIPPRPPPCASPPPGSLLPNERICRRTGFAIGILGG